LNEKGLEGYRIWRQTPIPAIGWQGAGVINVVERIESGGAWICWNWFVGGADLTPFKRSVT